MKHSQLSPGPGLLFFSLILACILSVSAPQKSECIVRVTLLQLNDVYQFAPVDNGARGGIDRVVTLRKQIESNSAHTLFLLAGDTISPSAESLTYKGAQMIEAWNAAKLDYATFGNHEFDFGPDVLQLRMKESHFKWLAANVIDKRTQKPFGDAESFVIREFGGVKVGLFGLVLPETKETSRAGPDIDFLDPCETAKRVVSELHERGAKVVVALTHMSMREDKAVAHCADVDVIIGGHEHTLLESAAGGAPIFKMTADARELGQINLNISASTGQLDSLDWKVIAVGAETKSDPQFLSLMSKYAPLLKELSVVVGRTTVPLDARSAANRNQETNIGDFIAEAFRKTTGADVGLMNGGSIRADTTINPGPLTKRDVLSTLPFNSKVVKLEVTGATLRAALEHGIARSGEDAEPGRFPQVAGIRFVFDVRRAPGSRLVEVTVNGQPLNDHKKYTLASTNFIALDGGDGYTMFKNSRVLIPPEKASVDADILRRAISSVRAIAPKTDGRIKRLGSQTRESDCN